MGMGWCSPFPVVSLSWCACKRRQATWCRICWACSASASKTTPWLGRLSCGKSEPISSASLQRRQRWKASLAGTAGWSNRFSKSCQRSQEPWPMKASTLLSVTVALFLGLAVAVGAKYSGFFSPKPPPPPPQPKPKPKVLVAAKNLFDGYTILQGDVNVRDMTEEEEADYREHKDKYLPPKPEVAILRVLNRSVEADQPIL